MLRCLSAAACVSMIAYAVAGCSHDQLAAIYPSADLRPPSLLQAGPTDARHVTLQFDEAVVPVAGSVASEPPAELDAHVEDAELIVSFAADLSPGLDYALAGEVDDQCGNRTRFLLRFTGWNDRAPRLLLSELQTGKNGSKTNPHRDFIELQAMQDGNVGGEELSWASSVKGATYRFPGIEVSKGDFLVLHLAPELLSGEIDELGGDLAASEGADATPGARDLWCSAMPLPDENGAVAISMRPGEAPVDGMFYAALDRNGDVGGSALAGIVAELASSSTWPMQNGKPEWDDAFRWKCSPARSLCRSSDGAGPDAWFLTAASGQSPGAANVLP